MYPAREAGSPAEPQDQQGETPMTVLDKLMGAKVPGVFARIRASLMRGVNRAIEARLRRVEREIAMFRIHHAAEARIRRRGEHA
jgi:hypothetical protein